MLDRSLQDLSEADFALLLANEVSEDRGLEFKRELPGGSETDVKEFLADISSLGNAQGGDLIFGIEDRKGVAAAVPGIAVAEIDATILRLESMIRDGLEPRLTVRTHWVRLGSGRGVLVFRVPASLAAPHRIKFKNNGRFWSRNSRGKYEMDVHELRHAFTQSEEFPQRLRLLHRQAIDNAKGENMPFQVSEVPMAVLSLMPLSILRDRRDLSLTREDTMIPVNQRTGFESMPTLEGYLHYAGVGDDNVTGAYVLTHRTGRIDAAWAFGQTSEYGRGQHGMLAWHDDFEKGLGEMVNSGVARLLQYGIEGPWVLMVTVLNMRDVRLLIGGRSASRPAWQAMSHLPELILEQPDSESLRPLRKAFWLLFGLQRPEQVD